MPDATLNKLVALAGRHLFAASLNTKGTDNLPHVLWFQLAPILNDNNPRCTGAFTNACPQVTGARRIN